MTRRMLSFVLHAGLYIRDSISSIRDGICHICKMYVVSVSPSKFTLLTYSYEAIVMQKDLSPLPNMLHAVNSLCRSFFNPLDLPPLAIISLSLKGMAIVPYSTALLQLQGFYSATDVPLISRSLEFDLGNTSNNEKYPAAIEQLLLDIKMWVFSSTDSVFFPHYS